MKESSVVEIIGKIKAFMMSQSTFDSDAYNAFVVYSYVVSSCTSISFWDEYPTFCRYFLGNVCASKPQKFLEMWVVTEIAFYDIYTNGFGNKIFNLATYSSILLESLKLVPWSVYLWNQFISCHNHRHPQYSFLGDIPLKIFQELMSSGNLDMMKEIFSSGAATFVMTNLLLCSIQHPHAISSNVFHRILMNVAMLERYFVDVDF